MKKLVVLLTVIAGAVLIHAQKIQHKSVPVSVTSALQKQYPEAKKVKWEKEKDNYEAGFLSKGLEQSVLFNASGNIIETEVPINVNALSASIKQFILKNYPNQKIKEAAKIKDSKGIITYEAEVNGKDLIFDNDGKFLREIKD
ncbi:MULTISPECIES: PepSY-like domain-containing protein [Chryseobacterium]|uniref:PepSY-like domain-containing protein n=1 Tax=Chryseobacterium TaxID=59732 RepID=UPI001BEBEE1D|nr:MULTISPECIES: PepSY-like domain-containing protein [Chryseobacterium]MBT2619561.1 PepSY-like domain-containing protein [Chryseobacterium sp. ISL-6]